jgi:hypothetical protein
MILPCDCSTIVDSLRVASQYGEKLDDSRTHTVVQVLLLPQSANQYVTTGPIRALVVTGK